MGNPCSVLGCSHTTKLQSEEEKPLEIWLCDPYNDDEALEGLMGHWRQWKATGFSRDWLYHHGVIGSREHRICPGTGIVLERAPKRSVTCPVCGAWVVLKDARDTITRAGQYDPSQVWLAKKIDHHVQWASGICAGCDGDIFSDGDYLCDACRST